jgi:hypothetical protein
MEPIRIEQSPDFAKLYRSLSDRPSSWTTENFDEFRRRIIEVLMPKHIPEQFAEGLIEYHLALFYESTSAASYRERFQAAYANLRWFVPFSSIARIVCAYFLYCANEFPAAARVLRSPLSTFGQAMSFLAGKAPPARNAEGNRASSSPVLIASDDLLTFQAIDSLLNGRTDEASKFLNQIRENGPSLKSRELSARIDLVEAGIAIRQGSVAEARTKLESLLQSPWPCIAAAAANQLTQLSNG